MPLKPRNDGSGKLQTGRPTKYKPEYCQQIIDFFSDNNNKLPFFSAFARTIGIPEETVIDWQDQDEDFRRAYKICKDIQKEKLIEGGLSGKYNPTFAIFTAKNLTDMKDQVETTHNVNINVTDYLQQIPERTSQIIDADFEEIEE